MTFRHQTLTFPSSDGKHNLNAEIYEPNDGKPVGVVQLSHGMADYVEKNYKEHSALSDEDINKIILSYYDSLIKTKGE